MGARSDVGRVRRENQDRISRFNCPVGEVFLVVDGMGGHRGGAVAAEMVVAGLEEVLRRVDPADPPSAALQQAASRTHQSIKAKNAAEERQRDGMGATAVLALIRDGQALIGHVGDSRAYLFRGSALHRLTRDHTLVQKLVDDRLLTEEQAREHPDASVVSRAFGRNADLEIEIAPPVDLLPGDRLLLCSDGLSGYVDDSAIQGVLAATGTDAAERLVDLALAAGGEDNVSVQVLSFGDPLAVPAGDPPALPAAAFSELPHPASSRRWPQREWQLVGLGALGTVLFLLAVLAIATFRGVVDWRVSKDSIAEQEKASDRLAGLSSPSWSSQPPGADWRLMIPRRPSSPSDRWKIYFKPGAEAWAEPLAQVLIRRGIWYRSDASANGAEPVVLFVAIPPGSGPGEWRGVRLFASPGADGTVADIESALGLRREPMALVEEVQPTDQMLVLLVSKDPFDKDAP